ncbi:protein phosphatase 2C domain-containing protein [Candidatus Synechococcus calcipolaris G9]|uniref:Protein phosphatase 2C domain-containing protein n=1 Tax=Candidatus Synechococcus calcipolaris G9 TaxID=1497997 RepID=A0ABT6EXJ3_9SYNE|nr:protein phosphatase 2C domain-containing protein [Candidatus Synechococcus calcipolaris]MDG2990263.1 protein phosphatase 2C domain-containing protein [Candidatus Synechococcus calcipolaris G9]
MDNALATIYCPECGSPNLEANVVCQNCEAPLPKRYLWAVGDTLEAFDVNHLLGDRYLVRGKHLLLDIQPGQPAPELESTNLLYRPYLKLFSHRLHIPQAFGALTVVTGSEDAPDLSEILLLEQGPITLIDMESQLTVAELPFIQSGLRSAVPFLRAWQKAGVVRRLLWLWQLISLWGPFQEEDVAASLLIPENLRVEGPILRLLQLETGKAVTLEELGTFCRDRLGFSDIEASLDQRFQELCQALIDRKDRDLTAIVQSVEDWLTTAITNHGYTYEFDLANRSDQGPSRKRNEDNCYPESGTNLTKETELLTVVCDGVGGHAGGDVASSLAIATLTAALPQLKDIRESPAVIKELTRLVRQANDAISERNDQEQRQDRQRMGTTLVAALLRQHQLFLAHIGDSRAYWITRYGCYQVTLDDDVASREVRLGMDGYHQSLVHPYSGSLIQALGMGASQHLHPNVHPFFLDEDCLLLLCSDGLSDYDRVEHYWPAYLLPILDQQIDVATTGDRLIELANKLNGHDNVTLSLIHCRVQPGEADRVEPNYAELLRPNRDSGTHVLNSDIDDVDDLDIPLPEETVLPDLSVSPTPSSRRQHWVVFILVTLVVGGLAAFATMMILSNRWLQNPRTPLDPGPTPPTPFPLLDPSPDLPPEMLPTPGMTPTPEEAIPSPTIAPDNIPTNIPNTNIPRNNGETNSETP